MTATNRERAQWIIKWLTSIAGDLSPSELEWTIKMEDAFNEYGMLTKKQTKILEDIYKKHS